MEVRKSNRVLLLVVVVLITACSAFCQTPGTPDPLPSWNDTAPRKAILNFVSRATTAGNADYIPLDERIAVFDNDGTLWVEQPLYTQFQFVLARVMALAPQHSEWKNTQPFQAVLEHDSKALAASGEAGLMKLMAATHTGMTTDEFQKIVTDWIATARHPKLNRLYTECIYQPMLELLSYLRANGFKTYIEFMRPWTEKVYGIPPEQVIGSAGKLKFEMRGDTPVLVKVPEIDLVDDKEGKPVGIQRAIGRRPVAAFGNSDGDQQMLEWTAAGSGARLMLIVHHTDGEREFAYDRQSRVGTLDKALDEAKARNWVVVSMKDDWKTIFPPRSAK